MIKRVVSIAAFRLRPRYSITTAPVPVAAARARLIDANRRLLVNATKVRARACGRCTRLDGGDSASVKRTQRNRVSASVHS